MRHSLIILLGGAMASLLIIPHVMSLLAQNKSAHAGELRERDEIRQTFRLAPGQRVEVSDIRGPVEIETTDTEVAEVHVVRSARSRSDLELYKVNVEDNPQGLTIRGEQTRRDSGYGPEVRHHVMLKLPRRIELSIQGVGGDVKVGDVGGPLVVNTVSGSLSVGAVDEQVQVAGVGGGVSIGQASRRVVIKTVTGDVRIGQVADSLDVTGVGGNLSAGISNLGQGGVQISTVTGQVELRFRDEVNAQLSTDSVIGNLSVDLPNVTVQSRPGPTAIRAMIGKGGPPISLKAISESVRLVKGS